MTVPKAVPDTAITLLAVQSMCVVVILLLAGKFFPVVLLSDSPAVCRKMVLFILMTVTVSLLFFFIKLSFYGKTSFSPPVPAESVPACYYAWRLSLLVSCGRPISIWKWHYDPFHGGRIRKYFLVPCQKCVDCLRARQQQLSFRAEWEALDPSNVQVLFCTFTYSPEYLPKDNELSKLEVQRFIRRLRLNCSGVRVRYFFCGEHGEQFDRAHYHAILYFDKYVGFEPILKAWPFGIVDIAPFLSARAGYVAKYSVKQLGDSSRYKQDPFLLLSNSLGEYFVEKHGDFIRRNNISVWYNLAGYPVVIPRYYIDKLFPPDNKIDREKEMVSSAYSSARSFLGSRREFRVQKRLAYDANIKVQSRLAGYSDSEAFKYDLQRGISFRCFNLSERVLNRVAYETGRY